MQMLEMIDIDNLEYLLKSGIVTKASIDRAKIINDFFKMKYRFRRIEVLYYELGAKHHKSFYTVRNIIVNYNKNN